MGQISLPRLEKINSSMSWESGLLYNKQAWAGPKISLVNNLLIKYFFRNTFYLKKYFWTKKYYNKFFTKFCFLNKRYNLTLSNRKILKKRKYRHINNYIYFSNNKYVALTIFSKKLSSTFVTNGFNF